MFKVNNINDLELIYSILREQYPKNQIDASYNFNTKEYTLNISDKPYKHDPEVPVDLHIQVVYGDSIHKSEPILVRDPSTGLVDIKSIQSVCSEWQEYPEFKILDTSVRLEKQYGTTHFQVWSDEGWTQIKKIIRHKTDKKMFTVSSNGGCVQVTEDHSLLDADKNIIKPSECNTNTCLLTSYPEQQTHKCKSTISEEKAYIFGHMFGSGSSDANGMCDFETLCEYQKNFYTTEHLKQVSNEILNCPTQVLQSFFSGFCASKNCENFEYIKFDIEGSIGAAGMYYISKNLGYYVEVANKENMYHLTISKNSPSLADNKITNITQHSPVDDFVYDIETECGRFNAGVGNIVVKNTDSVMLRFKYNREDFEQNRLDTFRLATLCGEQLTQDIFKRPPIELEFEKVFQPFILLTKKRYIANKYENMKDPFQLKGVDAKGIALTRRDYCKLVKDCYKDIIDTIMKSQNEEGLIASLHVFKKYISRIHNYEANLADLVVSAMLAKSYKSDNIAHVNLAKKLKERHEEVQVGDRIPYVFIETDDKKMKKSELAEDPKYVADNGLKYNRACYLESLAKPILGFYKVVLSEHPLHLDEIIAHVNQHLTSYGGKGLKPSDFKEPEN
jgi:hypothetical protein